MLGATQQELADGLGMTQGNVSNYERGQTVPPDVAARLVAYAKARGVELSLDHIYCAEPLPQGICAARDSAHSSEV